MAQCHQTLRNDIGLRAGGIALSAFCFACIKYVCWRHTLDPAHWSPNVVIYVLTAIGVLSASLGSALVVLGRHVFDRIEISERWRPRVERRVSTSKSLAFKMNE